MYKLLFKRQFVKKEKQTTNVIWNLAPKELMFAFIKIYVVSFLIEMKMKQTLICLQHSLF